MRIAQHAEFDILDDPVSGKPGCAGSAPRVFPYPDGSRRRQALARGLWAGPGLPLASE